jgi:hypothetical protein
MSRLEESGVYARLALTHDVEESTCVHRTYQLLQEVCKKLWKSYCSLNITAEKECLCM